MSKFLASIDLFSAPFLFNLQNNEQKRKTALGGLISITVFSLSIAYFSYICFLYSNNKIDPTVNYSQKVINENFLMNIENNIIAFQIYLPDGQTLDYHQTQNGVTYIIPTASYQYPDPNNYQQSKQTDINFIKCQDPDLNDFYCFDFSPISNMQNQMNIGYDASILGRYKFEIVITICDASIFDPSLNCASEQQFRYDFLRISTKFILKITTKYYNTQTRKFEKFTRNQQVSVSDQLTTVNQINLQRTSQEITEGFLFQQKYLNLFISDYTIKEVYFTKQFIFEEYGGTVNLLTIFQIQIGNIETLQQIQYPLFTYVLAQFASVFNVLLILGIIGQFFSQNQLILDFAEIQLKSYFKASAFNILKQINVSKFKVEDVSLSKHLTSMIKILIMSRFFDQKMEDKDSGQIKLFKELIKETQRQLSINELQKELMQMKIILRLLLSKEQFAAIQLCGYFINSEKQNLQNQIISTVKNKIELNQQQKNVFHEIEMINNEKKINLKQQNKIIDEKNQEKSEQKYDQAHQNKFFQSIKNIQDFNDERESQDFQIQSFNKKIIDAKKNSDKNTENNMFNENAIQGKLENHLEVISKIECNENYFEECIQKFLDKKINNSELDDRILGCMIGFNYQEQG
ncbi:hypothetical protein ABPG72_014666 [Tetrahymena utriculariae]